MSTLKSKENTEPSWKQKLHEIIFEADTPAGKAFDVGLLIAIVVSVVVVMLESVDSLHTKHGELFDILEWVFTILFTIEYILRLIVIQKSWKYAVSFFGIVDLLSILPTYLALFLTGIHSLMVIRTLRLLRVFRVMKLVRFVGEANTLGKALKASRAKITVFIISVLCLVSILGTLLYLIESPEAGFTSIPRSIYWAIVTLTTVGYGDIAPQTPLGQFVAMVVMLLGYGIIAVPTGIIGAEINKEMKHKTHMNTISCPSCSKEGHEDDAEFCKYCGAKL